MFPRGIIPTDVDGMVEINSWFLFIEQKRAGASLPEGQRKALQRLSTTSDRITVVIIREIVGEDDLMEVLRYRGGQTSGWKKETHDELRTWMDAWAVHADGYSD